MIPLGSMRNRARFKNEPRRTGRVSCSRDRVLISLVAATNARRASAEGSAASRVVAQLCDEPT